MQQQQQSNRAKKARLSSTYSGPILEYLRRVEGDFLVLDDKAYWDLFRADQLGAVFELENDGIGSQFALFADPKLECQD